MYKLIDADVIIIGSGLAGLTAAFCLHLKEPSLHFIVLEGSSDIGGRAVSVPLVVDDGTVSYFDVGGQWICREQDQLLSLLEALEISTDSVKKQGKIIVEYDKFYAVNTEKDIFKFLGPFDKMEFIKFVDKVQRLCRKIKEDEDVNCSNELSQITLQRFINDTITSKAVRDVIEYMVYFNCGIRTWQISALFYIFFCISTRGISNQIPSVGTNLHELRIKGGVKNIYDKIVNEIGRRHIFTEQYVTDVISNTRYVEVKTKNNSYYCYDVIVAVSPVDIPRIKFSPPLPEEKLNGITNISTNVLTNFVVTYPRDFWTEAGFSGDIYVFDKGYGKGPIDFCTSSTQSEKPAFLGRIFEGKAVKSNYPVYKSDILEQLSRYFGEEALNPVDYYEQSFSWGSSQMSCWGRENEEYMDNVPISTDRLFWACAETSQEWYGYLAGAVCSGNRAALEVLYDLRPSLLTMDDMMLLSPTRRSQRTRLKECPKRAAYYVAMHWKYYVSVGIIIMLISCKNKYMK